MAVRAEWLEKDYYDVLGVADTATGKELNRAYRRLARELHPDTNPGDAAAEERFKDVTAAYDVLGDAERRKEYDEARRLRAAGPADGSFPFRVDDGDVDGFGFATFDLGDLGDLLGDVLGGRRRPAGSRPRRGRDLTAELGLGFEDAVRGTTTTVVLAPGPDGPGEPGRPVRARIPAGVEDGRTIRLPGKGEPGRDGGPAGDLLLRVRVEPHRLFGRQGRDLTLTVPVTFPEAALGADITVPTLDDPVTVRIPAGTRSGRTFRVRGRGVPATGGRAGDLLVSVEVAVPERLTAEQREAVAALALALGPDDPRARLVA